MMVWLVLVKIVLDFPFIFHSLDIKKDPSTFSRKTHIYTHTELKMVTVIVAQNGYIQIY